MVGAEEVVEASLMVVVVEVAEVVGQPAMAVNEPGAAEQSAEAVSK